jgi:putative acetyltransferase
VRRPVQIRAETPADAAAIAAVTSEAFGGVEEAELIERLRVQGLVTVSLVAVEERTIVGHILFSELAVEVDDHPIRSVALAPMCVRNDRQRRGIGTALVHAGLDAVRVARYRAAIVLGHPGFYPRFGFSSALAAKLDCPFSGSAFMALELVPGALHGTRGKVTYPAAFGLESPNPSST